jgi:hypothetical protein
MVWKVATQNSGTRRSFVKFLLKWAPHARLSQNRTKMVSCIKNKKWRYAWGRFRQGLSPPGHRKWGGIVVEDKQKRIRAVKHLHYSLQRWKEQDRAISVGRWANLWGQRMVWRIVAVMTGGSNSFYTPQLVRGGQSLISIDGVLRPSASMRYHYVRLPALE